MKKPLSDKEILVNTICNNMREIIILSQDKDAREFAAIIIGRLTLVPDNEEDFEAALCEVDAYLFNMEVVFEFSYVQYVAQVTSRAIVNYWRLKDGN